jgi:hypothetical protein
LPINGKIVLRLPKEGDAERQRQTIREETIAAATRVVTGEAIGITSNRSATQSALCQGT